MLGGIVLPQEPGLNSVRTAHGNTDWHIDTAEEFLTGQEMGGTTSAANHCPDTWSRTHLHTGMTQTSAYYNDRDVSAVGQDNNVSYGIDQPMLFFYAGHGSATGFDTLGDSAILTNMRLGNCNGSNDGTLRYYWQCSCEVFAHGPKNCAGTTARYACPGDFDSSGDSDARRNVYERWGPIVTPALRMACGSSTSAYCHESETNKIWDNYNNKGYDVADSFIDGLHRYSWNTPLCMTTGGLLAGGTPLFDATFTNAPNPSGDYYHIQYLLNFDTTAPQLLPGDIPDLIPIYELMPLPLPDPYRKLKLEEKGDWQYSTERVTDRGPMVKVNRNSGAVYVFGERRFDEKTKPLKEKDYINAAELLVIEQGWSEHEISNPTGTRMLIQTAPKIGKTDVQKSQKNVLVTFKRQMTLGRSTVPVLGEGGAIAVQLNNDGTLLNASKVWRPIKGTKRTTKARPYQDAYNEATLKITESDAYILSDWTWGYEESAGNVKQPEMKAVYVFSFLPADPNKARAYPPRIIKISAHRE